MENQISELILKYKNQVLIYCIEVDALFYKMSLHLKSNNEIGYKTCQDEKNKKLIQIEQLKQTIIDLERFL